MKISSRFADIALARIVPAILIMFISVVLSSGSAFAGAPVGPLAFGKVISPNTIGSGSTTTMTFSIENPTGTGATNAAFMDNLPAAIRIATPANTSVSNCGSAPVLSAPDGGGTIAFSDGGIGAFQTCTIKVDITSNTVGTHGHVSGDLTYLHGITPGTSMDAIDDLFVVTTLPSFTKSFAPSSIELGGKSTLTLTIDNTANASAVNNLDFTDNLPFGIEIASPANASTTCGTATIPPTLSAPPGGSSIILDANGTGGFPAVAAGASCIVSVDVKGTAIGAHPNTVALLADGVSTGFANSALTVTSGGALQLIKSLPTIRYRRVVRLCLSLELRTMIEIFRRPALPFPTT